jgi:hypothetical protein
MFDATKLLRQHSELETERSPHDRDNQDVAELVFPRQASFRGANRQPGSDRTRRIHDPHGVEALDQGAALVEGITMPKGQRWQLLTPGDEALAKLPHVLAWFEVLTKRLFARRNDTESGYGVAAHDSHMSLLAFGGQSTFVDLRTDQMGRKIGLRYRSEFIGDIVIRQTHQGTVGATHRKFMLPADEAVQQFGRAAMMKAPLVLAAATDPAKERNEFEFVQCILPNRQYEEGRLDWRGKPFVQISISCADKEIIDIGGFRAAPRTYSRFEKVPHDTYGRGRAVDLLPTLRELQALAIGIAIATDNNLDPALLAADDAEDMMVHYAPGKISYGLIDHQGNRMVQRMFDAVDLTGAYGHRETLWNAIDRGFFLDQLMSRQEMKTHITASEIAERSSEKGMLLGPLSRQEAEWHSPQLDRELDCMEQLGDLDDMPGEVREAGGLMAVAYDNPLNRMLASTQTAGLYRTLDRLGPIIQARPDALDVMFAEYPLEKIVRGVAEIEGVPASWRATDEERQAKQEEIDNTAAAERLAALAPALGGAARDLSMAGQAGGL